MKKTYLSLMLLACLAVSCDMDRKPYGSLDETTAVQSMNDIARFRNMVYTGLRSRTSGAWVTTTDIQMDEFHGIISNGNRGGEFSNGLINSSTSDIEGFFASCYSGIATANSLIEKTEQFSASEAFTDEQKIEINKYQGEAYFFRAFNYFFLIDHYCQPYTPELGKEEHSGVCIVTKYNPSGDVTTYPSRSTLDESYELVESDLDKAYTALKEYESAMQTEILPNSAYLNSYVVAAMQARVALVKGDYQTAYSKAEEVINSGYYRLADMKEYLKMWTEDESPEVIFRPFMSNTEGLVSTGEAYTASKTFDSADYIPTFETIYMFEDGDVRFDSFFTVWGLVVEGAQYYSYIFLKYPGNESLRVTTDNNYMNMPKAFRLSETVLIAAEAAARLNNLTAANKYLNMIREARIYGWETENFNASSILTEILSERQCELIGEGFRMSDLRRLGRGFKRYGSHEENPDLDNVVVAAGRELEYLKDDHRFTWPIPKAEMDSNPNLAGQQNPGY